MLLKFLFEMSLENGIFLDKLKLVRIIPLFKARDPANISNYRPISVFPCFYKMLERIKYNCLHKHLTTEKTLYPKHFSFQTDYSTVQQSTQLSS